MKYSEDLSFELARSGPNRAPDRRQLVCWQLGERREWC